MIFKNRNTLYMIILFAVISIICGYITEKRSNTGFIVKTATVEEMEQYNSADNRIINGLININAADKEELETLDGIGEKTAQAIIDYRTYNGLFKSVDELAAVKGIGAKRLDAIRDKVCAE